MNKIARIAVFAAIAVIFTGVNALGQAPANPAAPTAKKNPLDKGDFKVGFSPTTKAKGARKAMAEDELRTFQEIAMALNGLFAMPRDIYLSMDTCGEANAFYSSVNGQITICYELIGYYEREFKAVAKTPEQVSGMVEDTLVQTLFHELGHCLIDVWEIPATGREEDAVDQLATIIMLDGSPEGQASAVNAALAFEIASRNEKTSELAFWNEHSFSKSRFYDMICLIYGSDPDKNQKMVGPRGLPEQRAERCVEEYKRAQRAWLKLLAPHVLQ